MNEFLEKFTVDFQDIPMITSTLEFIEIIA